MSYRDTLLALAGRTEILTGALWAAYRAGEISDAEFVEATAVGVASANARATYLADLGLSAAITVDLRRPIPTIGLGPPDDLARLRTAARTIVELDTDGRAARLGRSEPLERAARAYSEGIERSPHVSGWTRQTSGDACPLCTGWAADGVMPDTARMATHKGCSCTQRPITGG